MTRGMTSPRVVDQPPPHHRGNPRCASRRGDNKVRFHGCFLQVVKMTTWEKRLQNQRRDREKMRTRFALRTRWGGNSPNGRHQVRRGAHLTPMGRPKPRNRGKSPIPTKCRNRERPSGEGTRTATRTGTGPRATQSTQRAQRTQEVKKKSKVLCSLCSLRSLCRRADAQVMHLHHLNRASRVPSESLGPTADTDPQETRSRFGFFEAGDCFDSTMIEFNRLCRARTLNAI